MSDIIKNKRGNRDFSVQSRLKGKRSEYSLCWQGCTHFKPNDVTNCRIANDLEIFTMTRGVTTAVWECASFKNKNEK